MDLLDELFDEYQEVARSAFADMLHDKERNEKYSAGIKEAIDFMHSRGLKANVLDIGTGTGLLAMLAAKHCADSVYTCEAFGPVSLIARQIIEKNGFKDKIKMINKHSTKLEVGVDIPERANILVAEVLDTELIGEGAIETYRHAHQHLMEKDFLSVPSSAGIYVQIVESSLASSWNKPKLLANLDGEVQLSCPKNVLNCSGAPSIHDIQLGQIPTKSFKSLIGPIKVLDIDFRSLIKKEDLHVVSLQSNDSGQPNAIFFWWDIKMNLSGSILLSCAPHWAHPDTTSLMSSSVNQNLPANVVPWRDHWMQGVYFLKNNVLLEKNQTAELAVFHDEFSWWFELAANKQNQFSDFSRPSCECYFHLVNSRNRIGQLNDNLRNKKFMKLFDQLELQKGDCVLVLGDNSFLGVSLGKLVRKVYLVEDNSMCKKVMNNYIQHNSLQEKVELLDDLESVNRLTHNITHLFCESHFLSASLPWDNITIFLNKLKILSSFLDLKTIKQIPQRSKIFAVPVHFLHLYKIRHPLVQCESFDHRIFDDFVQHASSIADKNTETFNLWEYPCLALGQSVCVMEFDLTGQQEHQTIEGINELFVQRSSTSKCNGLALWVEFELADRITINNGPILPIQVDSLIEWNMNARQAVHLIQNWETKSITSIQSSCQLNINNEILMTFKTF